MYVHILFCRTGRAMIRDARMFYRYVRHVIPLRCQIIGCIIPRHAKPGNKWGTPMFKKFEHCRRKIQDKMRRVYGLTMYSCNGYKSRASFLSDGVHLKPLCYERLFAQIIRFGQMILYKNFK